MLKPYLKKAGEFFAGLNFKYAFLLFFLLLLLCNAESLFNPPHWDEIIGLHNQALFLAKHHFSFAELWAPGQHSFEGSDVYRFGLLPVVYGFFYIFLPPVWVHFLGHLFNIACIAGAGTILFQILRRNSLSSGASFLWTLAAFAEPLIAGRSAALGQECPFIFCVMLVIYLVFRCHFWGACAVLLFAGFIKTSAAVLCVAFLCYLLIRIVLERREWKKLLYPLLAGIACFVVLYLMLQHNVNLSAGGVHSPGVPARDGGGSYFFFLLRKLYFHFELYFPVLGSVIFLGLAAFVFNLFTQRDYKSERTVFQYFLLLTLFGFCGAYLLASIALPRYMASVSIPAFLLLALNMRRFRKTTAVLILLVGICAPAFYKKLPFGIRRSGEYLERSREYLLDIASNRRLCRFLESYREFPLVAPWPIVQMLTMPEMGYVKKPFEHVYSGRVPFYAPVKKLDRSLEEMPEGTVFVYHENDFEKTGMCGPSLLPDRNAVALYRDSTLGGLVIVYRLNKPLQY